MDVNKEIENAAIKCFERPVNSENIFSLVTLLNSVSSQEVDFIFKVFIQRLAMVEQKRVKSPEMLASWGIYLAIVLRYNPDINVYVNNEHFLLIGFKAYNPFIPLYITYFIIFSVIRKVDLTMPYNNLPPEERTSPKNESRIDLRQEQRNLAGGINANRDAHKIIAKRSNGVMVAASTYNPDGREKTKQRQAIIDHLIDLCPRDSPERKLLMELKRIYTSNPNFFIARLGLKGQKQEMAIFLDSPELIEDKLSEDDVMKAIYMHSNNILEHYSDLKPYHFQRAIACLNLTMAKRTTEYSDWISPEIFETLIFNCKELKHAKCLELLLLAITKNVTICKHHIKRLPEEWRSKIIEIYTTPRWKSSAEQEDKVKINRATMSYYATNLCFNETDLELLYGNIILLSDRLKDEDVRKAFLENIKVMNKSYFVLRIASYQDFVAEKQITIANTEDLLGNDIFEISRKFVIACREDDRVYIFSYDSFPSLLEKRMNPYNRQPLTEFTLRRLTKVSDRFEGQGLGPCCSTMVDFVQEMVSGRSILFECSCKKDYKKKLIRILHQYNIKEESIEWINLDDILMKFSLISLDFRAETIDELCEKLYRAIKKADEKNREQLRDNIASFILIYSRAGGGFVINI
jgi:hypothetical protein